jgi:hypothetical protein
MTKFRETDAAADFIASAASRETSPEVMQAIAFFARDAAEAEALWQGDGIGRIAHASDIWEHATGNGRLRGDDLFWGGRTLDAAVAGLNG